MSDTLLFKNVTCTSYLIKAHDGKFIVKDDDGNCYYMILNGEETEEKQIPEEDYDGSLNYEKTYYERVSRKCKGIVVGIKDVVITGFLYVDVNTDYLGRENTYIGKQAKEIVKCAVVYYANNKKHLVPVESIEQEG